MNYTSANAVCILCYLFAYGVVTCHSTDESSDESKSCDKDKKSSLSPEVSALYEMVERMRQQVMRLEDRQRQLESRFTQLTSPVGFSAYMDSGYFMPGEKEVLPFSGIISNFGNHYNRTTSQFKCPIRGVYFFQFTLYSGVLSQQTKMRTSGELMVDNYKVAETYTYNENALPVESVCGNSVLIECAEGSLVWVQSEYGECSVFGSADKETTFTGFLVNVL